MSKLTKGKGIALYGDDCLSSRLLIPRILEYTGYTTIITESGEDVLEKAAHHLPDMIVLDELCDIDNLDICQRLKTDERVKDIPVIILLAPSRADLRDKAIEMGAAKCLIKPIDVGDFQALIKTYQVGVSK
jgi:two-component system, OmpR family, alkaline phosphatase synthesis response regulator PhoP